ncbi:MAG: hypothetical protein AAGI30_02590 [Planctomycetota bacterium]
MNSVIGRAVAATVIGAAAIGASAEPWTMVVFPDTQVATREVPGWYITADDSEGLSHFGVPTTLIDPETNQPIRIFDEMAKWIVEAKNGGVFGAAGDERTVAPVRFIGHVGDIVNDADQPVQWEVATQAYDFIKNADLEYGVAMGNHDDGAGGLYFRQNLGSAADLALNPSFAGVSPIGNSNANVFTAINGDTYGVIHIAMDFPLADLDWASQVIEAHPDAAFVVISHWYMFNGYIFGARDTGHAQRAWETFISQHPQIFLVMSGHVDGDNHQVSTNVAGLPVIEVLQNFQRSSPFRSNGIVRLVRFDPEHNTIGFSLYSTLDDRFRAADDQAEDLFRLLYHQLPDRSEFDAVRALIEELLVFGAGADPAEIGSLLAILQPTPIRNAIAVLENFDPSQPDAAGHLIADLVTASTVLTVEQFDLLLQALNITLAEVEALVPPDILGLLATLPADGFNLAAIDSFDANLGELVALAFDQNIDADMDGRLSNEEFRATLLAYRDFLVDDLFAGFFADGSNFAATFELDFDHGDYLRYCNGDVDVDYDVDSADFIGVLVGFGSDVSDMPRRRDRRAAGDLDNDGVVGAGDFIEVLVGYQQPCDI